MSFNFKNSESQSVLQQQPIIAQIEQPQDQSGRDPLINYRAEYLLDFGIVLIVAIIILIIGMISKQMKKAILFALALSAFLILVLWSI